ncbi:hypothetical protein RAS1_40730 [Phycisphaerae bacterium RAS1]|nr:hypothetical protein RAS1_40730 [Phycisphaerae bacterium RAS1]
MTLTRTIVILGGALCILLAAVILRAETTRMQYETSLIEQKIDAARQELQQREMELARWRNPAHIRERVQEMRMADSAEEAAKKKPDKDDGKVRLPPRQKNPTKAKKP